MAFRLNNIGRWLDEPESTLGQRAAEKLGVTVSDLASVRVVRQVLDARKKNSPRYIYTLEVEVVPGKLPSKLPNDVSSVEPKPEPPPKVKAPALRPVIIGTGPAGLFCALSLLERGVKSIVLERGRDVVQRRKDVAKLMRDGTLEPESNMNFGEGGAGAYTDGKLSTRINHPMVRQVIETFARFGAPDQILIDGKPHIGSDLLPLAVEKLRHELIAGGCEVRFETRVEDVLIENGKVTGVRLADGSTVATDRVVLAPGNSARELFERFAADGKVFVEAKPFALGFRAEHPQSLINAIQYGERAAATMKLPPADYKLVDNLESGNEVRGVYSFCMCPGGIVVPTPTQDGLQCTNGMSNSRRNAKYANAGIVVSVSVDDFAKGGFRGPLAGLEFQRHWEAKAYELGGGKFIAPAQSIPDYLAGKLKRKPGGTSYRPGLLHADLNRLFPPELTAALKQALKSFDRKLRGFVTDEALLIGVESRTSSPVRVTRNEALQSVSVTGLYPAGEGCGYAGGIVSSGIDGLRIAEQIGKELA
ncbi:MAG: FAD-dependent oxidoreductase [Myxococcaceae bacterium]|nr:FAD-dependent oxidoreductase [Myxococcaceae bacterium]